MKTVYEMLNELKNRYLLYIERKSFKQLMIYIDGYSKCLSELFGQSHVGILENFDTFVRNYYRDEFKMHNWKEIILFQSHGDEKAFDNFYKLLEEFLNTNPKILEKEKLTQKKFNNFRVNEDFKEIIPDGKYLTSGSVLDFIKADESYYKDNEFVKEFLSEEKKE